MRNLEQYLNIEAEVSPTRAGH